MIKDKKPKKDRKTRRAEFKALPASERWKRRGKRLLKVVAALVVVVLLVVVALSVSFCSRHSEVAPAHPATEQRDAAITEIAASGELPSYDATQNARENADESLFISQTATGWDQTAEDFAYQDEAWGKTYDGTEPFKIMGAYCINCHTHSELGYYRATESDARAEMQSMVDNYGVNQLTDEQFEALVEHYTQQ